MLRLIPLQGWLYGKDITIDIISSLIIILILIYSIKFYRLNNKERRYKFLIGSFTLLALSFIAKILSHFTIYDKDILTKQIGIITVTYQTISQSHALIYWGLLTYRILSLFALYLFYLMYAKKQNNLQKVLTSYLILIAGYFGHIEYTIYHLTFAFLLGCIIFQLHKRNKKKKSHTTRLLMYGFCIILLSQSIFMFMFVNGTVYFVGELIQILGYLTILFTFIKVIMFAKKRKA